MRVKMSVLRCLLHYFHKIFGRSCRRGTVTASVGVHTCIFMFVCGLVLGEWVGLSLRLSVCVFDVTKGLTHLLMISLPRAGNNHQRLYSLKAYPPDLSLRADDMVIIEMEGDSIEDNAYKILEFSASKNSMLLEWKQLDKTNNVNGFR